MSFWGDFGPFLGQSGIILDSLWDHFGIVLASCWGRFFVGLTHFEAFWAFGGGLFLDRFGPFLRSFCDFFDVLGI